MFKQIVLISAASLALTACLPNKSTTSEGSDAPTDTDQYQAMAQALQTGGSAHCTITKEDGTGTIEYYAKGEKVRVSGITDETGNDNQYSACDLNLNGKWIMIDCTRYESEILISKSTVCLSLI